MAQKLTELRQEILEIIEKSDIPLQVKEINERITKEVNLTSVYRSLEFLEQKGYVQAISFNTNARYYFSSEKRNGHFLFCSRCNNIKSFGTCFASDMERKLEKDYDFRIFDHFLYFTGICKTCRTSALEGRI